MQFNFERVCLVYLLSLNFVFESIVSTILSINRMDSTAFLLPQLSDLRDLSSDAKYDPLPHRF